MIRMESESGWRTIQITYERNESMNGCMRWVIQKRHNHWPTLRLVIDAIRPFSISDPHWTLPPNDRFDRITIPKSWHRFLMLCTGLEEHRISKKLHWIVSWRIGEIGSSIRASIDFPFQQQRIDIGQDWSDATRRDATHRWMIQSANSPCECQRKNASRARQSQFELPSIISSVAGSQVVGALRGAAPNCWGENRIETHTFGQFGR